MDTKSLVRITASAGILSALCLAVMALALHDIFRDYASVSVVHGHVSGSVNLPGWSACAPEWTAVRICFWPMVAFHVVALGGLFRLWGRGRFPAGDIKPAHP